MGLMTKEVDVLQRVPAMQRPESEAITREREPLERRRAEIDRQINGTLEIRRDGPSIYVGSLRHRVSEHGLILSGNRE